MSDSKVCNGFIIDLSATQNTTQLVFELSSIMEHPDVQGKNILLKLLFEDNEELINLYNERFESNKEKNAMKRVYSLKF